MERREGRGGERRREREEEGEKYDIKMEGLSLEEKGI